MQKESRVKSYSSFSDFDFQHPPLYCLSSSLRALVVKRLADFLDELINSLYSHFIFPLCLSQFIADFVLQPSHNRIVVVAGQNETGTLSSSEICSVDSFSSSSSLTWSSPVQFHPPPSLHNGSCIVLDFSLFLFSDSSCWKVDLASTSSSASPPWLPLPPLPHPRSRHSSAVINEDMIVVAGGEDELGIVTTLVEGFSIQENLWYTLNPMHQAREFFWGISFPPESLTPSSDFSRRGRMLALGGQATPFGSPLSSCEIMDEQGEWHSFVSLPSSRSRAAAVLLPDRTVMVMGGIEGSDQIASASVDMFDTTTSSWRKGEPMPETRRLHTALLLEGHVFVIGGLRQGFAVASVLCYDLQSQRWSFLPETLLAPRYMHCSCSCFIPQE